MLRYKSARQTLASKATLSERFDILVVTLNPRGLAIKMWDDALRNWPSLLETDTSLSYPLTLDISPPSPSSDDDPHPSFALTENGIRMPNGLVTSEIQAHIEDESQAHDEETIQDTTALSDTLNDYANSPESTESHGVDDIEMGLEYSLNLVPEIDLDGALSGSLVVNLSR